jgi:hypothetical protein
MGYDDFYKRYSEQLSIIREANEKIWRICVDEMYNLLSKRDNKELSFIVYGKRKEDIKIQFMTDYPAVSLDKIVIKECEDKTGYDLSMYGTDKGEKIYLGDFSYLSIKQQRYIIYIAYEIIKAEESVKSMLK